MKFANGLTGSVPPELVLFNETLEILDLGQSFVFATNEFRTVLGGLTALRDLRYDGGNFISFDGIPTEIGNLKSLEAYGAANTLYSGALDGAAFPSDMTVLGKTTGETNRRFLFKLSSKPSQPI